MLFRVLKIAIESVSEPLNLLSVVYNTSLKFYTTNLPDDPVSAVTIELAPVE
jgi:hypothetical protein